MSKNYETLRLGSQGDAVRELQSLLKSRGYDIAVDGSFGQQTQNAVREYQKKYGLTVDGVVGSQTWGRLHGSTAQGDARSGSYAPSEEVISAGKAVEDLEANRPGAYQSQYEDALSELYEKIMSRPAFSYDLGTDPMYRQYRDSYVSQGHLAMEDTMGRAAGLTGGYGSSYSQSVGQQSYNTYLQGLYDRLPQLYDMALARYTREGQSLQDRYELLYGLEEAAYGRYEDTYDRWLRAYEQAQDHYEDVQAADYDRYMDMLDYWLKVEKASSGSGGSSGRSSGSKASEVLRQPEAVKAPNTQELKKLAQSYMTQGYSYDFGTEEMVRWMQLRGIPQSAYARFYGLLEDSGYKAEGNPRLPKKNNHYTIM